MREQAEQAVRAEHSLDVTALACPLTYAAMMERLEDLAVGERLEVLVGDQKSIDNAGKAFEYTGHDLLELAPAGPSRWRMVIERG